MTPMETFLAGCAAILGFVLMIAVPVLLVQAGRHLPNPREIDEAEPKPDAAYIGYNVEYTKPTPRKVALTPAQQHWEETGEKVIDINGQVVAPAQTDFVHAKRGT